jgi:four helix bundle protein
MEENVHFNFEKLHVYHKSLDFVDLVYRITSAFPRHEQFNLTQQVRRAVNSIPLNIGEGSGGSANEFSQFIRIAFRSLYECIVCSTIARRQDYIDHTSDNEIRRKALEIVKMLSALRRTLPSSQSVTHRGVKK